MPHMPDSHHATHDLELVAAFAAGDAAGADLETATSLVASCADCAALHHDLRAIAAALPELPAPVRPRDFRLTSEQAASLRPTGIRGVLAALASPRLSFATPLGTGLAALGVIGILVASGGLPVGGGATSGTAGMAAQAPAASDAATMMIEGAPASPAGEEAAAPASSPLPAAGASGPAATTGPVASGAPVDIAGGDDTQPLGEEPTPVVEAQPYANVPASPGTDRERAAADAPADANAEAKRSPDESLLIIAGSMLLAGLALVVLRWTSRRLA